MSESIMKIRRALLHLPIGESVTVQVVDASTDRAQLDVMKFAKGRGLKVKIEVNDDRVTVQRLDPSTKPASPYPQIDALQVGQSHLFELPPAAHQRLRLMATARNRTGTVLLTCNVEPGGLRVTRLPMTDAEAQTAGPIEIPRRASKYGLERLQTEALLRFELTAAEQMQLRTSVHAYGRRHSLPLTCRVQSDGSIIVARTDRVPAEQLSPKARGTAADAPRSKPRSDKWGLAALATQRELRLSVPASEQHKLRLAASNKARTTGWTIRCRLQDDGSMLVYRTDPGAPAPAAPGPATAPAPAIAPAPVSGFATESEAA